MSSAGKASADIAIVGMACRFPAAPDIDSFWDLLRDGQSGVSEVAGLDDWTRARAQGLGHAALLDDVVAFDAPFFRISPREAGFMDPQQRFLLELSWHALEDAGIPASSLRGGTAGVYIGISGSGYALQSAASDGQRDAGQLTGSLCSIAANRLSYYLGVHGPSLAVDTACSSSLVAIHLACEALAHGEADLALAGGVSLVLDSFISATLLEAGVLSPEGSCKTFDERADGYVRGEGAAILVLRPLATALRNGDRIYAVIRGSAVNQDGPSNGLMAPNRAAQEMVLHRAYGRAGIDPSHIDYIEAHGTGTLLGDPIEANALGNVVGRERPRDRPCRIGSAKTNIGHLEAAAGVAGIVKCCLMLHRGQFVPSLNFENCNPYIRLDRLNLSVQTETETWAASSAFPRRAGVSSFGIGGTNAHVVLEEAPAPRARGDVRGFQPLLAISAESPAALNELTARYLELLQQTPEDEIPALSHAAATQRDPLPYRQATTATSADELRQALAVRGGHASAAHGDLQVAFLFTGQGSQYPGMARELFDSHPIFRQTVEQCAEILDRDLEKPLLEIVFGHDGALLDQTVYSQPVIFSVEYALVELWKSWGIRPAAVVGHSIGELVAACVAGVLTLNDALRLVAQRGRIMQESSAEGSMLAAAVGEDEALALLAEETSGVEVAAINSPTQTVFTGRTSDLATFADRLGAAGFSAMPLQVRRAFHSALLDPVLPRFERCARELGYRKPSIPFISNVTGTRVDDEITEPGYWVRQARSPVRFGDGLRSLAETGCNVLLEIGSLPILLPLARESLGSSIPGFASLRRGASDVQQMAASLCGLFEHGASPDWDRFFDSPSRSVRDLPLYPFQRQAYWLEGDGELQSLARPVTTEAVTPQPAAPAGGAEALVVSHLSAITGHSPSHLTFDRSLVNLGITSIGLVELASALTTAVPSLEHEEVDWSEVETIADVVELVTPQLPEDEPLALPEKSTDAERARSETAAATAIVIATGDVELRRDPHNRVLESIRAHDGCVEAGIVVDQSHSFFFDHPYDHVPGVLFIEATQQLAEWLGFALGGEALLRSLQLDELDIRFESWGDLDTPLQITAERLVQQERGWFFEGSITGEQRCARFNGLFRGVDLEAGVDDSPESRPASLKRLVHKHRKENVLVSEPTLSDDAVTALALAPAPSHALRDGLRLTAPMTQLAEWTRQFLTARAHALDHESFDEHFILLSVHARLAAPIPAGASVLLQAEALQGVDTDSLRLGGSRVKLSRGERTLGQIEVFGAVADAEEYARARQGDES